MDYGWDVLMSEYLHDLSQKGIEWEVSEAALALRAADLAISGDLTLWSAMGWKQPRNLSIPHRVTTVAYEQLSTADQRRYDIGAEWDAEQALADFRAKREPE